MKALFLDRDGVINYDLGYVHKIKDFNFIPGIFEFCRAFVENGFSVVVVTNQSGIERGYFTEKQFDALTDWMKAQFKLNGVQILDVIYCPSLNGEDRKPKPGMFLKAAEKHGICLSQSVSVGDSRRDIEAAEAAGIDNNFLINRELTFNSIIEKCINLKILADNWRTRP